MARQLPRLKVDSMKFFNCFFKQLWGKSIISWIWYCLNSLIAILSFYYFGEDKKGLPNYILYPFIFLFIVTMVINFICESYDEIKNRTWVNPQEILITLYNSMEFKDSDVRITLYKVLDKPIFKRELQLLGDYSRGEILKIPMEDFYSKKHLIKAINNVESFKYFELDEVGHTGQLHDNIGFSESFIESYSEIPKYWFVQNLRTIREKHLKVVLIIESLRPITYFKSEAEGYCTICDKQTAQGLSNKISASQLLDPIIYGK